MPEAKPPTEQRINEIEGRKPKSLSLQKVIKPRSMADSGPGDGLRSKEPFCTVTFPSTGLSYKTLEWKVSALGLGWNDKVFIEAIHGTAYAGGESRLV